MARQAGIAVVFIVLARFVSPDEFGVVALALVIINFFALWADLGAEPMIARLGHTDAAELSAGFLPRVALVGLSVASLITFLAGVIAEVLTKPEMQGPLRVLAWIIPLAGASAVLRGYCSASGRFVALAVSEVAALLFSGGMALWLALNVGGTVALEAQVVASYATAFAVLAFFALADIVRAPRTARAPWGAASGFAGFIAINYWARNADNLLVGRFLGLEALGLYERAYQLMFVPVSQLSGALGRIMVPLLAQHWDEVVRLRAAYTKGVQAVACSALPLLVTMSATAPDLSVVLFGPNWYGLASLLTPLAAAGALQSVSGTVGWLYQASGRGRVFLRNGLLFGLLSLCGIVIGVVLGSSESVAFAYSCTAVILFVPVLAAGARVGGFSVKYVLHGVAPMLVAGPVAWCMTRGILAHIGLPPVLRLSLAGVVCLAVFYGTVFAIRPRIFRSVLGWSKV
jgi:PST family polysaccharide transporter